MKINRLVEILIRLLNKRTVTANELSEHFGVSVRTIYRDIDILSTCGIPIYTTQGYKGGISLLEDYTISKTFFTQDEKNNILFSLKTLQATKYPNLDCALDKLSTIFNAEALDWINIDFEPWGVEPSKTAQLMDIKYAILNKYKVTFDYINAANEKSQRLVEPRQLRFKGRYWYLWAWDVKKLDYRMFKLSRIRKFIVTIEHYDEVEHPVQRKYEQESDPKRPNVELELIFQPEVLYRLYDDYEDDLIMQNDDGTYTVRVSFPEDDWLYGYILSFGANVRVIKPGHLQQIIENKIKEMKVLYK